MKTTRKHAGFTLIEVVTYVSLLSASLVLLIGYELNNMSAIQQLTRSNEIALRADELYMQIERDIAEATSIELKKDGRRLVIKRLSETGEPLSVHYDGAAPAKSSMGLLLRRYETRPGQQVASIYYPYLSDWQFRSEAGASDLLMNVSFEKAVNRSDPATTAPGRQVYAWRFNQRFSGRVK